MNWQNLHTNWIFRSHTTNWFDVNFLSLSLMWRLSEQNWRRAFFGFWRSSVRLLLLALAESFQSSAPTPRRKPLRNGAPTRHSPLRFSQILLVSNKTHNFLKIVFGAIYETSQVSSSQLSLYSSAWLTIWWQVWKNSWVNWVGIWCNRFSNDIDFQHFWGFGQNWDFDELNYFLLRTIFEEPTDEFHGLLLNFSVFVAFVYKIESCARKVGWMVKHCCGKILKNRIWRILKKKPKIAKKPSWIK